ncbi:MAG TPA: DUF3618 domain-containing protein [Thermoanaerobaculia bacterium]|nr:DUF3618 domain-containing protein [Thermoanaerobaculia bacterium]
MAQTEDFVTNTGSTYRSTDTDTGSGQGSEAIRSDIDRTRANMDETFAALDAKLTPSQLLLEGWNLFRGGSTAGASKLWRVAREHPMPAAVIGLGLGWLLVESSRNEEDSRKGFRGDYGYGRGTYGGDYGYTGTTGYATGGYAGTSGYSGADYDEESGGRLSAVKDKVKDAAESAKDAVSGAGHKVGDKVGDAAGWTKEHALDLGHRTKDQAYALRGKAKTQVRRARVGFWQTMEENPLMVGAATLALGVIAGLAIPSTRKEDEMMGETRDRLVDEVKEAGQQAMEKGKHVAEAVVDKVKDEAQSQGLTPETVVGNVAEKVKTVAREAVSTAKEEAQRQNLTPDALKSQGQPGGQVAPAEVHEPELVKR